VEASDWIAIAALVISLVSVVFSLLQANASRVQAKASVDAVTIAYEALAIERKRSRRETMPQIGIATIEVSYRLATITLRLNGPQDVLRDVSFAVVQPSQWSILSGALLSEMRIGRDHSLSLAQPAVGVRRAIQEWRQARGPAWLRPLLWYVSPATLAIDAAALVVEATDPGVPIEFMIEIRGMSEDGPVMVVVAVPRKLRKRT
jgi:hypothetical protein